MAEFSTETKKSYDNLGFTTFRNSPELLAYLDDVKVEIDQLASSYGLAAPFSGDDVQFDPPVGDKRNRFYRSLRYLPSLGRLANSSLLSDMSKVLGLNLPLVMNASNIRMDQGGLNPNKFHWHQDFTYLLGSMNSVTFWIPLQDVSAELGGIEIVPASHKENLRNFKVMNDNARAKSAHLSPNDLQLEHEPEGAGDAVELKYGEGAVFSQFLLHRSLDHIGPHTRWTVQVRISDAADDGYREFDCPMGDTTTILQHDQLRENLVVKS